jgi:hypothetical protein
MTDMTGLWEHARYLSHRPEHGYCTDDNARALIVVCREPDPSPDLVALAGTYINFVIGSALEAGGFRNRRNSAGAWIDEVGSDDSQGRALWALGTAAHLAALGGTRVAGTALFSRNAGFESPSPRANAFAILGAVEMLAGHPEHEGAMELLSRCSARVRHRSSVGWRWLESRLTYDNARLPEALLAAGSALGDDALADEGLSLLDWLATTETRGDQFSFTPAGGWGNGEPRPGFDQQPIEAGAMADACYRAWLLTGDQTWRDRVDMATRWFLGANDNGSRLYDPRTGGCCDGLTPSGVNRNHGAESTLSALMALQRWFQAWGR